MIDDLRSAARQFSSIPQRSPQPFAALHRMCTERKRFRVAAQAGSGAESNYRISSRIMKTAAEVCPLCAGSGWKPVPGAPERGVTRCDCQLQARSGAMIAAARIPKRYEHCELSNFTTDFPGADHSIALAQISASRFVQEFDPRDGAGLLLVGGIGTGKTHLAVGTLKNSLQPEEAPAFLRLSRPAETDSELLQRFRQGDRASGAPAGV